MMQIKVFIFLLFLFTGSKVFCQKVFKTPTGSCYHLSSCRMVENVSESLTLTEAVNIGLRACKFCNPPATKFQPQTLVDKSKGEAKTVQCKGKTKKGTRCKHRTKIANGYCFQHNPEK